MCCLFGLIDYGVRFSARERNRIIAVLSRECEVRGTDATGIAFNTATGLHIYKRPLPAHKLWYSIPKSANVIMGHTRLATQGSETMNYNNHPFYGHVDKMNFAFAHNGVLHNDTTLRKSEHLPNTHIQTDSYIGVQLIEKENTLSFESIRKMAEKTEGSFCYTILNDKNDVYLIKGDNPLALYKFDGFYMYASTDEILQTALRKLGFTKYSRVNLACGNILKIDCHGELELQQFEFKDIYTSFMSRYYAAEYIPKYETVSDLMDYAGFFGVDPDDIEMLFDYGYDELEIEEMLYDPIAMQRFVSDVREAEHCLC